MSSLPPLPLPLPPPAPQMSSLLPPQSTSHGGGDRDRNSGQNQNRPSFQVLLTNLPIHLHHNRVLRDWILSSIVTTNNQIGNNSSGGTIRNVLFVPAPKKDGQQQHPIITADPTTSSSEPSPTMNEGVETEVDKEKELEKNRTARSITALLTLSNADMAFKIVSAFRICKKKIMEDDEIIIKDIDIYQHHLMNMNVIPIHPEIPLPPPIVDPIITQVLGEQLYDHYKKTWKNHCFGSTNDEENHDPRDIQQQHQHYQQQQQSQQTTTTASTTKPSIYDDEDDYNNGTGNFDDEEDDPLTSPIVLMSVQRFRQHLEKLQGSKATRRKDLVQSKITSSLPYIRDQLKKQQKLENFKLQHQQQQQMMQFHQQQQQQMHHQHHQQLLPVPPPLPIPPPLPLGPGGMLLQQPPLPSLLPPPMSLPPPPTAPTASTIPNPRGVSNLPAWMTQQQQDEATLGGHPPPPPLPEGSHHEELRNELNPEVMPASKRMKTSDDNNNNMNVPVMDKDTSIFPLIMKDKYDNILQLYITEQIKLLLGVEEVSLIELIYQHIIQSKSVASILNELSSILDDDEAISFIRNVWIHIHTHYME